MKTFAIPPVQQAGSPFSSPSFTICLFSRREDEIFIGTPAEQTRGGAGTRRARGGHAAGTYAQQVPAGDAYSSQPAASVSSRSRHAGPANAAASTAPSRIPSSDTRMRSAP